MTLLDVVSKVRDNERVTVTGDEVLIDCFEAVKLRANKYFKEELADKEVTGIGVGLFCEVLIYIAE